MLNFLPSKVVGAIAGFLLVLNVIFWIVILFIFSIPKILIPWPPLLKVINKILQWIGENWIACNSGWMWLTQKTRWDVEGAQNLNHDGWYMVVSNHQSWVDILVMQHLLNRKIPILKILYQTRADQSAFDGFCLVGA